MRKAIGFSFGLLLLTGVFAQAATKTFDAASVKVAEPIDMVKMAQQMQNGEPMKMGMHVNPGKVDFIYVDLKTLISIAYKLKPYQITGPDWLANTRFDILAKFPPGATRDDIPEMLQALLVERLKLVAHLESKEHPVLGLIVGKNGPKLVESKEEPKAIDENAPLQPGEMAQDGPDGQVRITQDKANPGSGQVDMGTKGKMKFKMNGMPAPGSQPDLSAMSLHFEGQMMTMAGFVEMLSQFSAMGGGGTKQVVDMTNLKGHYEVAIDVPFSDLMNMARAQGMDVNMPGGGGGATSASGSAGASDPSGGSTIFSSVTALGLRLEPRKAVIDQLVVDKAEKVPTAN